MHFNSHAHVERDRKLKKKENGIADFNSHAHVERDIESFSYIIQIQISTHTLTWSVTFTDVIINICRFISTHTLTWSVTHTYYPKYREKIISTHTLTWSVTKYHF